MDQNAKIDGIKLDLLIDPELEKGKYTNMVVIEPSENEVFLNFLFLQPPVNNIRKGEVQARVITTPLSLKKTIVKLIEWLKRYEEENGSINLKHERQDAIDAEIV